MLGSPGVRAETPGFAFEGVDLRRFIAAGWIGAAFVAVFCTAAPGTPREVTLRGTARDETGAPLPDLEIKTFVDGFRQATGASRNDGAYSVVVSFDEESDPTVVVWWIPREAGRVPELAILRESARARILGIWSPCIPRLESGPEPVFDVVICREAEKLRRLRESDCLGSASPVR